MLKIDPAYELDIEAVGNEWVMNSSLWNTDDIAKEIGRGLNFLEDGDYVVLVVTSGDYHDMAEAGIFEEDSDDPIVME